MDQFDRGSRMRAAEETLRQRLRHAERSRSRQPGDVPGDVDSARRRPLLAASLVAAVFIVAVVLVIALGGSVEPEAENHETRDGPPQGVPTQRITQVQPPVWLPAIPLAHGRD